MRQQPGPRSLSYIVHLKGGEERKESIKAPLPEVNYSPIIDFQKHVDSLNYYDILVATKTANPWLDLNENPKLEFNVVSFCKNATVRGFSFLEKAVDYMLFAIIATSLKLQDLDQKLQTFILYMGPLFRRIKLIFEELSQDHKLLLATQKLLTKDQTLYHTSSFVSDPLPDNEIEYKYTTSTEREEIRTFFEGRDQVKEKEEKSFKYFPYGLWKGFFLSAGRRTHYKNYVADIEEQETPTIKLIQQLYRELSFNECIVQEPNFELIEELYKGFKSQFGKAQNWYLPELPEENTWEEIREINHNWRIKRGSFDKPIRIGIIGPKTDSKEFLKNLSLTNPPIYADKSLIFLFKDLSKRKPVFIEFSILENDDLIVSPFHGWVYLERQNFPGISDVFTEGVMNTFFLKNLSIWRNEEYQRIIQPEKIQELLFFKGWIHFLCTLNFLM